MGGLWSERGFGIDSAVRTENKRRARVRALRIWMTWLLFPESFAGGFQDAMPETGELPLNLQECRKQRDGENRNYQWVGKDIALAPDSEGKWDNFQKSIISIFR